MKRLRGTVRELRQKVCDGLEQLDTLRKVKDGWITYYRERSDEISRHLHTALITRGETAKHALKLHNENLELN